MVEKYNYYIVNGRDSMSHIMRKYWLTLKHIVDGQDNY